MIEKEKIKEMLIRHEGMRLKPYEDSVGKLTIGVGRNLDDVGIRPDEAEYLLQNDIDECMKQLSQKLSWFETAPDNIQLVLIDMCFNLGIGGLLSFKNTLELIRTGQYKEASQSMLKSLWAKQVGKRAIELSDIVKSCENGKNISIQGM
jgi:lysozyme